MDEQLTSQAKTVFTEVFNNVMMVHPEDLPPEGWLDDDIRLLTNAINFAIEHNYISILKLPRYRYLISVMDFNILIAIGAFDEDGNLIYDNLPVYLKGLVAIINKGDQEYDD